MERASDVAKWLVNISADYGDSVTNLKLQKLLYYAQAWYLVLYNGRKLFREDIEAWIHGPVVPSVYQDLKHFGIQPVEYQKHSNDKKPSDSVKQHLLSILKVFGGFSAFQLELMTHSEDPWKNARKGLAPDEPSHNVISTEDMRIFYSKMLAEHEQKEKEKNPGRR